MRVSGPVGGRSVPGRGQPHGRLDGDRARSGMKTPPLIEGRALPASRVRGERDRRFLLFVGMVLVAVSLSFKSELVGPAEVWGLGVGLLVLAVPALMGYLHTEAGMPSLEHFVPVVLGTLAVAGLSL